MDLETLAIRYQTQGEAEVNASLNRITDSTRQLTLTQMQAIEMNDALATSQTATATATQAHGFQVGRLRQDLGSLVGRLTGTSQALDRVGGALGAMAIGNVAIIGVLAAVAAIAFGYEKLSLSLKGVTADQEKAIESFEKAEKLKAAGGETGLTVSGLTAQTQKAQAKIDELNKQIADVQKNAAAPGQAAGMGTEAITDLKAQVAAQQKIIDDIAPHLSNALAQQNAALAKGAEERQLRYAEQLATLIKGNKNTQAQYDEALRLEKNYYAASALLAQQGNLEVAAEYQKLGDLLASATDPKGMAKGPKEKKDTGLKDFLDQQKSEVAALKATHALQVKIEEDAAESTDEKYRKIKALDQNYLLEVGSIYGFESAEYDSVLKEMQEHRKQHTDAIIAEIKREVEEGNRAAEQQSIEDENALKKKTENAKKLSNVLSTSMAQAFADGFKGGGVAGAMEKFADMVLSGLGNLLVQLGEQYISYGGIMNALSSLLYAPHTAGPAALAIGAALIALGSALGSVGHGGSGGGGGGGGPVGSPGTIHFTGATVASPPGGNSATTTGNIKAQGAPINLTLLGPNDPVLQRQLIETIKKANVR